MSMRHLRSLFNNILLIFNRYFSELATTLKKKAINFTRIYQTLYSDCVSAYNQTGIAYIFQLWYFILFETASIYGVVETVRVQLDALMKYASKISEIHDEVLSSKHTYELNKAMSM